MKDDERVLKLHGDGSSLTKEEMKSLFRDAAQSRAKSKVKRTVLGEVFFCIFFSVLVTSTWSK